MLSFILAPRETSRARLSPSLDLSLMGTSFLTPIFAEKLPFFWQDTGNRGVAAVTTQLYPAELELGA